MGAASENFCLRWNDFESNVSGAFRDLRAESDFFDVTLGCSDGSGRTLQAHKVILSACSSFFKNMLRQMAAYPHPNPYIYLRGVSYCDLSSVLDFMYHGEVNVAQEDLNSFLAVAEELQIKGLTNKDGEPTKKRKSEAGPPTKRQRRSSPGPSTQKASSAQASENNVKSVVDIKSDPEAGPSGSGQAVNPDFDEEGDFGNEGFDESYYDDNGDGEVLGAEVSAEGDDGSGGKDEMDQAMVKPGNVMNFVAKCKNPETKKTIYRCKKCGKTGRSRTDVSKHVLSVHAEPTFEKCEHCNRVFRNAPSLHTHLTRKVCLKQAAGPNPFQLPVSGGE